MAQTYVKQMVLSWLRMVHRKVCCGKTATLCRGFLKADMVGMAFSAPLWPCQVRTWLHPTPHLPFHWQKCSCTQSQPNLQRCQRAQNHHSLAVLQECTIEHCRWKHCDANSILLLAILGIERIVLHWLLQFWSNQAVIKIFCHSLWIYFLPFVKSFRTWDREAFSAFQSAYKAIRQVWWEEYSFACFMEKEDCYRITTCYLPNTR